MRKLEELEAKLDNIAHKTKELGTQVEQVNNKLDGVASELEKLKVLERMMPNGQNK